MYTVQLYTLLLPRHGGPLLGPALLPGAEADSAPDLQRVVLHSGVVGIEELFEPLQELEIVLELLLYQLVHVHRLSMRTIRMLKSLFKIKTDLVDIHFLERRLQQLEIVDALMFQLTLKFNSFDRHQS